MLCYCGSKREYEECCKSFVMGEKQAETPEQLMRSRFTAYCIQDADYLVDTQHESTRHPSLKHSIEASFSSTEWLSLSVVHSEQVGDNGIVEFIAFFQDALSQTDAPKQLHEKSSFVFENNRWFYVGGEFLPDIKLGRNDTCWCGSGKKLKKCHG